MLTKIHIQNYRVFEKFDLDFTEGVNVLVADNDAGKSTVLEAIALALTNRLRGRLFTNELSPHLFNQKVAAEYVEAVRRGENPPLPEIVIDLFVAATTETADLRGSNNSRFENACGLRIKVSFQSAYEDEYATLLADRSRVTQIPIEYYHAEWLGFHGRPVTSRSVPIDALLIDATTIRLQSGADHYLQRIIHDQLDHKERAELAIAYRGLREAFSANAAIASVNVKLGETQKALTNKDFSLAIDVSQRASWETSLVPHLDALPLPYIGSGGQHALKIMLALNRAVDDSHVVLIEEPENHQSPASLNILVRKIAERCGDKQVFVTTHSSFVLNKLGLDRLILLGTDGGIRPADLPTDTLDYFKKLSGYDTLRIVLASRVVLVEGPSDELVIQRVYADAHGGRLPIEDGIDVINVRGLSFARFLDIAKPLGKKVVIVRDNDDKNIAKLEKRYEAYTRGSEIRVFIGTAGRGKTLEPQLLTSIGLADLNATFDTTFSTDAEVLEYMEDAKTTCALRLFERGQGLDWPEYMRDAVGAL